MSEDAKMSKYHIYTAYPDFKGEFGGMGHRKLCKTMRELRFLDCCIDTCEQLYKLSGTYYRYRYLPKGHHMAIHRPCPYTKAQCKETPYHISYSRYSWNHYSGGSS